MTMINITEKDVKRGVIVEPAWYRVRIDSVGEKTSKSGTSQNYPIEGTILFNGDSGNTKYAGTPTPNGWLFNDGAIGFAVGFLVACGADEEKIKNGGRFNLEDAVGKEIDVWIENGTWDGRTVNKVPHKYRRPKPEVTAQG